jgi:nucleoside-triphosphatase THEP1
MDLKTSTEFVAQLLTNRNINQIIVITGDRGDGKTTLCQSLVTQAREMGKGVSGILAPSRIVNGQRTGMFTHCLQTDERRLLASLLPEEINGRRFGPWSFDPQVFAWGNMYLASLKKSNSDLLVIDELGFLEFDLHEGWISAFDLLSKGEYQTGVIVVRPECIESFADMGFKFEVFDISSSLES